MLQYSMLEYSTSHYEVHPLGPGAEQRHQPGPLDRRAHGNTNTNDMHTTTTTTNNNNNNHNHNDKNDDKK